MLRNLLTGLKWGVSFAVVFSLYVIVLYMVRGPTPFEHNDTTFSKVLAAYWVGGLGAGLAFGILFPLRKSLLGTLLIGAVAGIPVGVSVMLAVGAEADWHDSVRLGIAAGAIVGPVFAIVLQIPPRGNGPKT